MYTVARYEFHTTHHAEQCIETLWKHLSGGFYRSGIEIFIERCCTDLFNASQICVACGGQLKGQK